MGHYRIARQTILLIILALGVPACDQGADVQPASMSPLETVEAWIARYESGDVEGFQSLMAENATYLCTDEGVLFCGEPQPYFGGSASADASDARASRLTYVADGSLGAECSADGSEVTCDFDRENLFHEIGGVGPVQFTYVLTVEGGTITAVVDERSGALPQLPIGEYRQWVQAHYPDEHDELFFSTTMIFETQDQMESHRALIAEWAAAQAP